MTATKSASNKSTPSSHDPTGFATSLLNAIGATPTKAKVAFINEWMAHEGNNGPAGANGVNNPLNIEQNGSVANFSTPEEGVAATAQFLKGSNYTSVLAQLKKVGSTPLQLAAAVTDSPFDSGHYGATATKSANGQTSYVGGSLVGSFLPSGGGSTIVWGDVTKVAGTAAHYAAHPESGLQEDTSAASSAASSSLDKALGGTASDAEHYILYGLAVFGGVLLVLVALILIGADIGIEKIKSTKVAQTGGNAASKLGGGSSAPEPGIPLAGQSRRVKRAAGFKPRTDKDDRDDARRAAIDNGGGQGDVPF